MVDLLPQSIKKSKLQFRFWPAVIVILCFCVLCALGSWQLQRLFWKQDLITTLNQRLKLPEISLPAFIDEKEDVEFRYFKLYGRFIDESYYLISRAGSGENGLRLISPFIHQPNDGDPVLIMVDRGWIPFEMRQSSAPPPVGEIVISGLLRMMRKANAFLPDNNIQKNVWYFLDKHDFEQVLQKPVSKFYIMQEGIAHDANQQPVQSKLNLAEPRTGDWQLNLRNHHLGYAITWFSLAVAVLIMFVVWSKQNPYRYVSLDKND